MEGPPLRSRPGDAPAVARGGGGPTLFGNFEKIRVDGARGRAARGAPPPPPRTPPRRDEPHAGRRVAPPRAPHDPPEDDCPAHGCDPHGLSGGHAALGGRGRERV